MRHLSSHPGRRAGVLAAALALLAAGCAGSRPSQRLQQEAARFVYVAPPAKLLAQARALLEERGYTVHEDPSAPALSTAWKQDVVSPGLGSQARRYLVVSKAMGEGRTLVRIYTATHSSAGTSDTAAAQGYAGGPGSVEGSAAPFGGPAPVPAQAKGNYQRDLEMEWRLLERLEPELARELAQEHTVEPEREASSSANAAVRR